MRRNFQVSQKNHQSNETQRQKQENSANTKKSIKNFASIIKDSDLRTEDSDQLKSRSATSTVQIQEQKKFFGMILTKIFGDQNKIPMNNIKPKHHLALKNENSTKITWCLIKLIIMIALLTIHTNAATCFNDKLPSFIMDTTLANEYVWQTVIITKDDRFLFKGGYVKINSTTQTTFPGAPVGTYAIAGYFDTLNNYFIWVKMLEDENISSAIISALALNYNEDILVLAGTSTNAKKSFYFFVDPMTGEFKYPSFTVEHGQDFHFLTSQSILLAGASRLYCSGISMQYTYVAGSSQFTNECANIGQTCSGTDNSFNLDTIQYLVVDYATQTVVWHKIANNASQFGAGSVACLIDVNPTASVNGQEHVIMGGGFSPVLTGTMTQWKESLISIDPATGQLDLIAGLKPTSGTANDATNYPFIVHMEFYSTNTQWSIFTMTQSRLMSTNGIAVNKTHLCQINFNDATYTIVAFTICRDVSFNYQWKTYGTGIKYDPIAGQVHFIFHDSNLANNAASGDLYYKINIVAGAYQSQNGFYNSFISNAGVFTKKPLVTLSNTFQLFSGYFVGYQKSFTLTNFPTSSAALSFTKNAAIIYPYDRAETCYAEVLGPIGGNNWPILTTTLTTQSNLIVGLQTSQMVVQRKYKTTDLQFSSLLVDKLCGTSTYTPLTVTPGAFHDVNLYISDTKLYQCPFTLNTLNDTSCTDSNEQIYSIDESSITGSRTNIFTAVGVNSTILIKMQDTDVLSQNQKVKVTSTTPSGQSAFFNFTVNLRCGPAPLGFDACTDTSSAPTCLTAIDPISVFRSVTPSNITYDLGSAIYNVAQILPFSLVATCTYCSSSDIVYSMNVTPQTVSQSVQFITFNATTRMVNWTTSDPFDLGSFDITISGLINRVTAIQDVFTFKITVKQSCAQSLDVPTIKLPKLTNQNYIWTQTTGSYIIPEFTVTSTQSICNAVNIEYQMSVTSQLGQNTNFITFDSIKMQMNWYEGSNQQAETFTIKLTATITNQNAESPFNVTSSFLLIVTKPTVNATTHPYFKDGGPALQYYLEAGNSINLSFPILEDDEGCFEISVILKPKLNFTSFEVEKCYQGKGSLIFKFQPDSSQQNVTVNISIVISEIFDPVLKQNPQILTSNFILKVQQQMIDKSYQQNIKNQTEFVMQTEYVNQSNQNDSFLPQKYKNLQIRIESISKLGLVNIIFNQPLNLRFDLDIVTYEQKSDEPVISFNWTHKSNTSTSVEIQLQFSKPLSVSAGKNLDKIQIYLAYQFQNSTRTYQQKLVGDIPLLISSEEELEKLSLISDTIDNISKIFFWLYLFLFIFFSIALSMLWGTFQTLQVIIAMPVLQVMMPANVLQVFKSFKDVVNMKIVDSKQVYAQTFGKIVQMQYQSQAPVNLTDQNFTTFPLRFLQEKGQFEQENLVNFIVMCSYGLAILLILISIIILCQKYAYPRLPKSIKNLMIKIKAKIMWSSILRYITQSYLDIAINCMLTLYNFKNEDLKVQIFSCLISVYILVVPLFIFFIMWRNRENLENIQIKQQIGSLYMNFETTKNSVFHFTMVFLYRRLIFAITVAFVSNVVFQIYLVSMSSLLLLIYIINWEPMDGQIFDFLVIFNEAVLLLASYLLFLYTEYVPDPELRYKFGNIMMYLLYFNFSLNILLLLIEIVRQIIRQFKRCHSHRVQRKQIQIQNQQKIENAKKIELGENNKFDQQMMIDQVIQSQKQRQKSYTNKRKSQLADIEAQQPVKLTVDRNKNVTLLLKQESIQTLIPKLNKQKPISIYNLVTGQELQNTKKLSTIMLADFQQIEKELQPGSINNRANKQGIQNDLKVSKTTEKGLLKNVRPEVKSKRQQKQ